MAPFQARLSGNRPQQGESSGFNFETLYQTQLFGSELNLREASNEVEWLTWLAGFRWLQVSETLEIRPGPGSFDSFLKYATSNCLVGGQVGADTRLWSDGGPFSLDGIFKAGVFGNVASNEFTDIKKFAPPVRANDNLGAVSFVGEIGITGVYRWTDHVALRGGYELLWVQGVAVAGDQPDATHIATHNGIDGHSGIFFQGVVIGLEFTR